MLATLPDESVHCVVTSPPYWGLRDYGIPGQIGLERTPEEYVAALVEVFREVRRVLRKDGTLWLNLGDSYAGSWGAQSRPNGNDLKSTLQGASMLSARQIEAHPKGQTHTGSLKNTPGLKPKDLVGIPWRVAFALQQDGWWLRSDIVWAKPNPMPESVTDRPTRSHEYLFLLTRNERYFYDAEAIAEPCAVGDAGSYFDRGKTGHHDNQGADKRDKQRLLGKRTYEGFNDRWGAKPTQTRNKRDVWTIATEPFPGAHFAVMPTALVEPCVLAGCPEGGTVLDPFGGSGTVASVAKSLGRSSVYIDANPKYAEMARRRVAQTPDPPIPLFNEEASQ
ncbi:MAG: site-specific DNA-methyltransferase [Thermaerobacter sp.]|nr:site-specific DNA-methyltransferase [Thermaerobacter sp.]